MYWSQIAKIKWLNCGYRNSKLLNAITIQRRDEDKLIRINDDNGHCVEGQTHATKAVMDHCVTVFSFDGTYAFHMCMNNLACLVSVDKNMSLTLSVLDDKVKDVVFSLGSHKAHGPNEMNDMFYK